MTAEEVIQRCGSIGKAKNYIKQQNAQYSDGFIPLPLPEHFVGISGSPIEVFRNNRFLVQVFDESDKIQGMVRLSVIRSALTYHGEWEDGVSWEELMEIKTGVGYGDRDAVEVFPRDDDVVNVANMRHLWVFPEPIPWKWK